MIGNPNWFSRRKYTGWGFTPKTWQGWIYVIVMIAPIAAIAATQTTSAWAMPFMVIWAIIFAADFIHIMRGLKKDERERIHEAIAERNALWAMLAVLVIALGYQVAVGVSINDPYQIDPFILAALIVAVIAKAVTNMYLDRKD